MEIMAFRANVPRTLETEDCQEVAGQLQQTRSRRGSRSKITRVRNEVKAPKVWGLQQWLLGCVWGQYKRSPEQRRGAGAAPTKLITFILLQGNGCCFQPLRSTVLRDNMVTIIKGHWLIFQQSPCGKDKTG